MDNLDLELLIAHELKKSREFVLTYPETELTKNQEASTKQLIKRRLSHEPLAYILGHKEFYGLNFKVTKDTLIPRPETELLVEKALQEISSAKDTSLNIIDVGTGSGNIIISVAKNLKNKKINYFGIDISKDALKVASYNARKINPDKKINFLHGNLLEPLFQNLPADRQGLKFKITCLPVGMENSQILILANLPYLSKKIYSATAANVRKFEPKSALYSPQSGLEHYKKLLKQIGNIRKKFFMPACPVGRFHISCFMEISPEQKKPLHALIKNFLPSAKIKFQKDLAGKWRICFFDLA
jgi:release factor glutamine methyltransferase